MLFLVLLFEGAITPSTPVIWTMKTSHLERHCGLRIPLSTRIVASVVSLFTLYRLEHSFKNEFVYFSKSNLHPTVTWLPPLRKDIQEQLSHYVSLETLIRASIGIALQIP